MSSYHKVRYITVKKGRRKGCNGKVFERNNQKKEELRNDI